ncbi:peptidase [Skermania piniformis]|uniref:Peptidase n=1 Tax=Skermania pinensis TaxID=39122 RepID=A0ABX8SAI7_9ACTN|nr:peptidase [Skermania piniformis]QXQ13999.1 peptidase [Skermania piniformis]
MNDPTTNEPAPAGGYVGVAPFQSDGALHGFVISGRWPNSTKEWAQLLALAVRVASVPGLLATTTVFGAREDLPEDPQPDMVGLVVAEGPVLGERAVAPGRFARRLPPALLMLHPPSETRPSLPECVGAASGCVLLPGVPHLGLEHRAAWVEAESDGTVTSMVSRVGVDPIADPDTAVLAMLLAA